MAGPNMARDESLAGQSVKQGNYTITYNENGYATKAVNDGGKSATSAKMTTHANDSAAHQEAYKAAQNNDWDAVGVAVNKIGMQTPNKYGGYDMAAANQYMRELQDQFKYNAKDYYNNQYDKAYGAGSASVYDMTNGAIKSYGELESLIGAPKAQSLTAQYGASASVPSGGQASPNDMTKYLEDMFTQNLQAELSALKNAYDSNVAELESQNDRIAEQYRAARNQAAAQNALESQRMNEYALAQGLNTGTSGQMALAQNMAYQNNLGNIWAQEAQKQADVDLALAQLMRDYNANVNQTTAEINAQRAEALYDEMVRQENLARAQQEDARDYALTMLSNGVMPDAATLSAAGISGNEAQLWYALGGGTIANTATSAPAASAPRPASPAYNNGGLTSSQVKMLQEDINKYLPEGQKIAVDGVWGPATQAAAGGFSAKEYADEYFKQNSWSGRSDR